MTAAKIAIVLAPILLLGCKSNSDTDPPTGVSGRVPNAIESATPRNSTRR
jgi:hypothetical protein